MVDAGKVLLYDVRTDLGERNDLASQRQDIAQALRPLITAWEADVDAEAGKSGDGGGGGRGGRGRGGRGAAQ
jgi:hypothetical protein